MFQRFPFRFCKKYICDCCLTNEDIIDNLITKEIERMRRYNIYQGKVLLLGIAEAGKSTFLKQMKLMHNNGFKTTEKIRLIPIINQQILHIIQSICRAMVKLNIQYEHSQNQEYANLLNSLDENENKSILSLEIVEMITNLWSDTGIQQCYHRRREYSLTDSAKYFLDSIDRICQNDYIPTNNDILRVRIPTTGIVQENFQLSRYNIQIVDVGGQNKERLKWIYCFDNVTTVIFLASLIEYDQYDANDHSKQNLMEESLALFYVILSSDYLQNASIILFLNKTDLFAERLANKPLRLIYPEFQGADDDVEAAKEFIKGKYLTIASNIRGMKRTIYSHFTCSIDSKNIKIIFEDVKDKIFDDIMNRIYPYF